MKIHVHDKKTTEKDVILHEHLLVLLEHYDTSCNRRELN